jgi:hypothetical protein
MSSLLTRTLARNLRTIAKAEHTRHLRVLKDQSGQRLAQKLYGQYCSQEDYSKYPAFCQELDSLLHKYGGNPEENEDDDTSSTGNKNNAKPEADDNDGRDKF